MGNMCGGAVGDSGDAPQKVNVAEEPVDTLIFDIDDTLYDVGCGFTGATRLLRRPCSVRADVAASVLMLRRMCSAHRNGDVALRFMVEKLGFKDRVRE
eukprot:SAG11_NODE_2421_length_3380_cov_2.614752_1_plen_98_part_00